MRQLLLSLFVLYLICGSTRGDDAANIFEQRVLPVLKTYCTECHSGTQPKANLNLSGAADLNELHTHYHRWFNVLERVESGSMPPVDADPLKQSDKQALLKWIRGDLTRLLVAGQRREGRSRFRRLSRNEYANTVQDIFGIRPPVVRILPADGRVDGYDKVSKALPFSPAAIKGQLQLAEATIERLFELPRDRHAIRLWADTSWQSPGHLLELPNNWVVSFNTDTHSGNLRRAKPDGSPGGGGVHTRKPGWHRLQIHAYGYQTDKPLPVGIYAGHTTAYPQILKLLKVIDIPPGKPSVTETDLYLGTGRDSDIGQASLRLIPLGLGVPVPKNTLASEKGTGSGLALQWVDVVELEETLAGQDLLFGKMPEDRQDVFRLRKTLKTSKLPREEVEAMIRRMFARIGGRLFRRDLSNEELNSYVGSFMKAADDGAPLRDVLITQVSALMTAPDFLCVMEEAGRLNDFALASRLSYFLWNSTPDAELLAVARQGKLNDPNVLRSQTERLLKDPKSDRFVESFLDQWLGLWGIDNTTPDKDLYPEYDDELKISSMLETQASFRRMLDEDRSVRDFVAPDWAMVNTRLAEVYGIPDIHGFRIRSAKLPAHSPYGGIWTQAATMKVTANGTLTSPVKRGVWLSDRLLGISIPPPPPTVEPADPDTRGARTLREQLELHRQDSSCKACHARFDPYGFALESFDVMGNYRKHYRIIDDGKGIDGLPVDCTGTTPDGKDFADVRELRAILARNPEQLARGVVRHLLTYATGEPATPIDRPAIEAIVRSAAKEQPRFGLRSLIHSVVQSEVFRWK